MSPDNSFPIAFSLRYIDSPGSPFYGHSMAEPSVASLTQLMRNVRRIQCATRAPFTLFLCTPSFLYVCKRHTCCCTSFRRMTNRRSPEPPAARVGRPCCSTTPCPRLPSTYDSTCNASPMLGRATGSLDTCRIATDAWRRVTGVLGQWQTGRKTGPRARPRCRHNWSQLQFTVSYESSADSCGQRPVPF